jgi:plasmid stabilization system protein ParE
LKKVRFLDAAQEQLRDAALYYQKESQSLAYAFVDAVDHTVQILARQPKMGPEFRKGTRRVLVKRFPIALFYRLESEEVLILVVWHTSRDPQKLNKLIREIDT